MLFLIIEELDNDLLLEGLIDFDSKVSPHLFINLSIYNLY
jgi:hypothetical protein